MLASTNSFLTSNRWDVLGGGKLQTKKHLEERKAAGDGLRSLAGDRSTPQTEVEEKMSAALEKVAKQVGVDSIQAVALAYVMQKTLHVFPIIGGRKVEYLKDNIKALSIHLTDDQIKEIESVSPFDVGFPLNFVGYPYQSGFGNIPALQNPNLEFQLDAKPIGHS
jgi:aryl-alcohol dehydrogenase-like predicted oxidoreductase